MCNKVIAILPNKLQHWTAIPLRSSTTAELIRWTTVPRLPSIATVHAGARHRERVAPGGKVMERRTHNNASDTFKALVTCVNDRLGQDRPVVSGYHRGERR